MNFPHPLLLLLSHFGTEWTGPSPPEPFASRLEQQDFVSCVLRLLCCHVTLAGGCGGGRPREDALREGERRRLEKMLYSLVDLHCPADVLGLVHACLNKGADLLLPDLETREGGDSIDCVQPMNPEANFLGQILQYRLGNFSVQFWKSS